MLELAERRMGRPPTGRRVQLPRLRVTVAEAAMMERLRARYGSFSAALSQLLVLQVDAEHAGEQAADEASLAREKDAAQERVISELMRENRKLRAALSQAGVRKRARRATSRPDSRPGGCVSCGKVIPAVEVGWGHVSCGACRLQMRLALEAAEPANEGAKGVTVNGKGVTPCKGLSPKGVTPFLGETPGVPPEETTHDQRT